MSKLKFEIAKILNTVGLKKYGAVLWNAAEQQEKKIKWNTSNIENTYVTGQGIFSNNLLPKKEVIEKLAEEQIYSRSMQFFDVFGFAVLRNFLGNEEVKIIDGVLNDFRNASATSNTIFSAPVENSKKIQQILIHGSFFDIASKIIGPFWYSGSDAAVETGPFSLHRDTFFNPPLYKMFIPTKLATFQVLCGSHHTTDEFSRNCGRYVCAWDKTSNNPHGSSSIYFEEVQERRMVTGYDDSHKNPPLTNIPLNPGDVFIFNQNLIHGLLPRATKTSFIAITAFASPESSAKFKMNRQEHLESIIKSTISAMLVDKELSGSRKIDSNEVALPGKAFPDKDLEELIQNAKLKEYFGLARIPLSRWETEIKNNSHASWEILRNLL